MTRAVFAAIETGGTKTLCRVVDSDGAELAMRRWPTDDPETMVDLLAGFIAQATPADAQLAALGIAAFGPLVLDPAAAEFGRMLNTTKPGWTGSNLAAALTERLGAPVAIDTDVNAAAIAEQMLGAGRGCSSIAYVTVGTGIGGGLATNGKSLKGALHPEIGHIRLIRRPDDTLPSGCPFHGDCAEGLTAGPAIARRLAPGIQLADDPQVSALVADYLGQLLATLVLAWSPQRIVLGGGVMKTAGLIDRVSVNVREALGDYGAGGQAGGDLLAPAMLEHAGLDGALLMARDLTSRSGPTPAPSSD